MTSDGVFGLQIAPMATLLDGIQSALNPQGPAASEIAALSWLLFAGAVAIFVGVIALAVYAMVAHRGRRAWMARTEFVVAAGILFPLVVLTGLLIRAFLPSAGADHGPGSAMLRIEVVGEQWWWRVHYLDADGGRNSPPPTRSASRPGGRSSSRCARPT